MNSESDIQKKLRYLLPKDYAKDNRRFRPTNEANMRLRLQTLQICEHKSHKRLSRFPQHITSLPNAKSLKRKTIYEVEGAYTAFRTYGAFIAPSTHIALAPPAPTSISTTPPSQLVNPFLVMLDGSTVAETLSGIELEIEPISKGQISNSTDLFRHTPPLNSIAECEGAQELKPLSAQSLRRRLASKYTQAYFEHINSVLQYSSPSSLGSSLVSATHVNSWKSGRSSSHNEISPSNASVVERLVDGQNAALSYLPSFELWKSQENVWDELVDESMVSTSTLPTPVLPDYTFMCAAYRQCCKSLSAERDSSQGICSTCGFTRAHRLLRHGIRHLTDLSPLPDRIAYYIGQRDYFDNTPLHCAAASGHVYILQHAIEASSPSSFHATNTSGEGFLHLLRCTTFEKVEIIIRILTDLKDLLGERSLSTGRDYHGRTMLHRLFQSAPDELFDPKFLRHIFDTTALDIHAADNFGASLLEW
jgi:ankyrin repeat protein